MGWDTVKAQITVSLSASRAPRAGFGEILLVDTFANSPLAGASPTTVAVDSRYARFSDTAEAEAVKLADTNAISNQLLADIAGIFADDRAPPSVGVFAWGGLSLDAAIAGFNAAIKPDPYAVVPVTRTLSEVISLALSVIDTNAASARRRIVVAQTNDVAAVGGSWAATTSALTSSAAERLHLSYHGTAAQPVAAATASRMLSFDLDGQSNPWEGPLSGVVPSEGLSSTERGNLATNRLNYVLDTVGQAYTFPGVMQSGRDTYVVVTRDWFEDRLRAAIVDLQLSRSSLGVKLGISSLSQDQVVGIIETIYALGVSADHFLSRDEAARQGATVEIRALPITDADKTARRLRFRVQLPVLLQGKIVSIDVFVTE
jgi:hypothetical protein